MLLAFEKTTGRTFGTSPKISAKFQSDDSVGDEAGVSGDIVRNYYDSINREHKINDALRVIAFLFHI